MYFLKQVFSLVFSISNSSLLKKWFSGYVLWAFPLIFWSKFQCFMIIISVWDSDYSIREYWNTIIFRHQGVVHCSWLHLLRSCKNWARCCVVCKHSELQRSYVQILQKYCLKSSCDYDQHDRQLRLNSAHLNCIIHTSLWENYSCQWKWSYLWQNCSQIFTVSKDC